MSASFPLRGEGWERGSVRTFDDHLFLQFRVALCGRWGLIYKPPQKNSRAENDATSPTIVRLVEFSLGQIKLMDFFVWLGLSRGGEQHVASLRNGCACKGSALLLTQSL